MTQEKSYFLKLSNSVEADGPFSLDELMAKGIAKDAEVFSSQRGQWCLAEEFDDLAPLWTGEEGTQPPQSAKNTEGEIDPGHSEKTGTADRLDAVSEDQTDLGSILAERPAHEPESKDAHGESEDAEGDDNEVEGMQDATVVSPKMFQNVFSSSGRIRRTEYGLTLVIRYVLSWMLGYVVGAAGLSDGATTGLGWLFVISVPLWIWVLSQGAKRCHDLGNSGWYQIIPFYGLWMLFASGDDGSNEYGPSPK